LIDRVFRVLGERSHARALAWLFLSSEGKRRGGQARRDVGHGKQLRLIAELVHRRRVAHRKTIGVSEPTFDDTLNAVALASFALFGLAIAGPEVDADAGIDRGRFVAWFTRLLVGHLERG
jgi:hypothetical protein